MLSAATFRAIRALKRLSQADLAERAGVTQAAVAAYELDKRDIRVGTLRKLCAAMGVTVTYTVDDTDISEPL
jgi:transcriptional regulator with XRE-family HTH domain